MKELRITKYDPLKRDLDGAYLNNKEWTCFSDIGTSVSKEDYEKAEQAYIDSAQDIVSDSGTREFLVVGLEDSAGRSGLAEGKTVKASEIERILRMLLRNECWCRLESDSSFIHVGWDFYMYVGAAQTRDSTLKKIEHRGLYSEDCISPYHRENC